MTRIVGKIASKEEQRNTLITIVDKEKITFSALFCDMVEGDVPLEIELAAMEDTLCDIEKKYCERKITLHTVLNASLNSILITDPHMYIRYFNHGFCTMWDLSKEDIQVGAKIHNVLELCMKKTLEPEMFYLNVKKIHHSKDRIWKTQVHLSNKKIFQGSSSPVRGVNGTYYGRIWEFVDITEYIQREEILHDAFSTIEVENLELETTQTKLIHQNSVLATLHWRKLCLLSLIKTESNIF